MKYFFYSHYIALLVKGKLRIVQVILSIILCVLPLLNFQGILNFTIGKSNSPIDIACLALFVYMLANIGYASFNQFIPNENLKEENKKPDLTKVKQELPKNDKNLTSNNQILGKKTYTTSVKTSPKKQEEPQKQEKPANTTQLNSTFNKNSGSENKEGFQAPPLDVNYESAEEFFIDEKQDWNKTYSGVINENYTPDITDVREIEETEIIETPLAETRSALFERVRKNKFT